MDNERHNNVKPVEKLFIVGFDPRTTTYEDIQAAFEKCGHVRRIDLKKTFAFISVNKLNNVCK